MLPFISSFTEDSGNNDCRQFPNHQEYGGYQDRQVNGVL